MNCPVCGKSMMKRHVGKLLPVKPPKIGYRYWCGQHSWQGDIFYEQQMSDDEIYRRAWQEMYG